MASMDNESLWQKAWSRGILYGLVALGSVIGGEARYLVGVLL